MGYEKILMATFGLDQHSPLFSVTRQISDRCGAAVSLLHVKQQLCETGSSYRLPSCMQAEEDHCDQAQATLIKIAKAKDLKPQQTTAKIGFHKRVVFDEAQRQKTDLLIIEKAQQKNHKQKTINLLPTAPCDILMVSSPAK